MQANHTFADELLHEAYDDFANGRLLDALESLQRCLTINPDSGRGWELLGLVFHGMRTWGEARIALEQASLRVPLTAAADCALADSYLAEGQRDWAKSQYKSLIGRRDVSATVLLATAAGFDHLGEPGSSVVACRRALAVDPGSAQSYFDLSYYLGRCGAPDSQIEANARYAINLAPDSIAYRIGLAGFLHTSGRSQEAADLLQPLTHHHVSQMCCQCCLIRLLGVFEAVGDEERASWCRQRHFQSVDHIEGES